MNAPSSTSKGPMIALLLLLVAGGLGVGTFFLLKNDSPARGPETPSARTPADPNKGGTPVTRGEASMSLEKAATGIRFTVRCVGTRGGEEPLAGVEVSAIPAMGVQIRANEAQVRATDAEGKVEFTDMPYKSYNVIATPPGYYTLRVAGVVDGDQVPLVYREGIPISGVVKNEEGQPLEQVHVQLFSGLEGDFIAAKVQQARRANKDLDDVDGLNLKNPVMHVAVFTDAAGEFSFPVVPKDYNVRLTFFHDSYDTLERMLTTYDKKEIREEYVLLPRTEILGKVLDDASNEPLAGVLVQATEGGVAIDWVLQNGGADVYECTTDTAGNFRIGSLQRGRQMLQVKHTGYDVFVKAWELTQREPFEMEIRLKREGRLSGRVVDLAGQPVADARVMWIFPEALLFGSQSLDTITGMKERTVTTGPDGLFDFRGVSTERPLHLIAMHPNYVEARNLNLVVAPGENLTGIDLVMTSGGSIAGTVQTVGQAPLAGAVITATPVRPAGAALDQVVSAADGTFTVFNTRPGVYELACEADGYCKKTIANVEDVSTGVSFFLVAESVYRGNLVADDGKPLAKFRVRGRKSNPATGEALVSKTCRSSDGSFELKGLEPDSWDFEFTADGFAPRILHQVVLREGETTEARNLTLELGAAAEGHVLNTHGRPVVQALVRLEEIEPFVSTDRTYLKLQTQTDDAGHFRVGNLVPGLYKLYATHPQYATVKPVEVTIQNGAPELLEIKLPRPAKLRLFVRDQEGNTVVNAKAALFQGDSPLSDMEIVTSPSGGGVGIKLPGSEGNKGGIVSMSDADARKKTGWNTPVDEKGELVWNRKEPGEWSLWVMAQGYYKYLTKVTLVGGEETVHEAVLEVLPEGADPREPQQSREERRKERRERRQLEKKGEGDKPEGGGGKDDGSEGGDGKGDGSDGGDGKDGGGR